MGLLAIFAQSCTSDDYSDLAGLSSYSGTMSVRFSSESLSLPDLGFTDITFSTIQYEAGGEIEIYLLAKQRGRTDSVPTSMACDFRADEVSDEAFLSIRSGNCELFNHHYNSYNEQVTVEVVDSIGSMRLLETYDDSLVELSISGSFFFQSDPFDTFNGGVVTLDLKSPVMLSQ